RILEELTNARAAIVGWTEKSLHSEWVLAEASQARKDGKLIAVRAPSLPADQIPLPFGEVHTERLEDRPKILAAVVAQLARLLLSQMLCGLRPRRFGIIAPASSRRMRHAKI